MITITYYPNYFVKERRKEMQLHLEELKSKVIEPQTMLNVYNRGKFQDTKPLVKEAIKIDGEFTDLVFKDNFTNEQLMGLNIAAKDHLEKVQEHLIKKALN